MLKTGIVKSNIASCRIIIITQIHIFISFLFTAFSFLPHQNERVLAIGYFTDDLLVLTLWWSVPLWSDAHYIIWQVTLPRGKTVRPVVLAGVKRPALVDFAFATVATLLLLAAIVVSTEDNCTWIHSDTLRGNHIRRMWSEPIYVFGALWFSFICLWKTNRSVWALYAYFNQ